MALAVVHSRALVALDAPAVRVETHVGNGLPAFQVVGLPAAAVRESRDRVRAALVHTGFEFPNRRLTVNLSPADLPKDSGRFDLPIALGVLAASGQLPPARLPGLEFVGELSLTGEILPIRGALAMLSAVRSSGATRLVLPAGCAAEARLIDGQRPYLAKHLTEVVAYLREGAALESPGQQTPETVQSPHPGLSDVRGHLGAKRALEIAAAGGHSLLMVGPPGAGKSMLAQRITSLMPALSPSEAMECALVRSIAGRFGAECWGERPFRSPHHSASAVALVGGGSVPRPGEITLAHRGVLFLDELPEFDAHVLEALREPLECGELTVARAAYRVRFPARFQLVAAMNPCPCGFAGSRIRACCCTGAQIQRYRRAVSGPLLDRIDLRIAVEMVPIAELARDADAPSQERAAREHAAACARVQTAAARQRARQGKSNAELGPGELQTLCRLAPVAAALAANAADRLHWSARAYHRVLRVGRTVADLVGADIIDQTHLAEAIQFRREIVTA
ncbi:MAG: YifB family Mg chelatase-like AAA ATPase [Burkholderiaceae bacterium]|nr:YifB family Mg chelatase-like AAA ATPase [Burkholderiaceae bacterium]